MTDKRCTRSIYIELPEDVLEAVRILLIYFRLPRHYPKKSYRSLAKDGPRPLYGKAIKKACRILGVNNDCRIPAEDPNRWDELNMELVKKRLLMAGIDPDDAVMNPVDQERFNLAWEQLLKTGTFSAVEQQKALSYGHQAPPADAILSAFVYPKKKKTAETNENAKTQSLPGATHSAPFKLPKFT
jgi:hypothetical protein